MSKAFVLYTLFGKVGVDGMLSSLFLYLSNDDANMLKDLIAEESGIDDFSSDKVFEFLEQFKVRSLVTKFIIKDKLAEVARQELIQKPHIMTACWKPVLNLLREEYHFNCKSRVFCFYDKVTTSNKKLLQLPNSNAKENLQRETLMYFKRYIKALDDPNLRKLVQFLTGSDVVAVDKIEIVYYKHDDEFYRGPIYHTCGPCLEPSTTYNNFCELREEFNQVLQRNSWEFNIA